MVAGVREIVERVTEVVERVTEAVDTSDPVEGLFFISSRLRFFFDMYTHVYTCILK